MSSQRAIGLILILVGLTLVIGFAVVQYVRSKEPNAGLKVDSRPSSQVYVNNQLIGSTPIDKVFQASEITLKLIPDSTSSAVSAYETKVRLNSNTYTVVRREFGDSDTSSAGDVVSLQTDSAKSASLSVVTSVPDSASVSMDNQPLGFTPLVVSDIGIGSHQIDISAPGFVSRTILAKAVAGYKLALSVKLSGSLPQITPYPSPATPSATLSPSLPSKSSVTIGETPTGFLNVRSQPTLGGSIVGQVNPGKSYPVLDKQPGWYLIQADLTATSSGWVSSQYATPAPSTTP